MIAVAIIAVGAYFFPSVTQTIVQQTGLGAVTPSTTNAQYATESTGAPIFVLGNAVTGPNSTGATNYTGFIESIGYRAAATSGTTTPCAIQNPTGATSTIESAGFMVTTSTSTAMTWVIGTTTSAFATSSNLTSGTFATNAQALLTYDASSNTNVIGPTGWIVFGSGATVGIGTGGVIFQGICQATFQSIATSLVP